MIILNLVNVLVIVVPMLLAVAFMTIIERKQLAAHQRRVGPQITGYFGILQPFADALKLILKENVVPTHANKVLFFVAPIATLILSLLGWAIVPFGQGICLTDFNLGILYTLALSSLGVTGVLYFILIIKNLPVLRRLFKTDGNILKSKGLELQASRTCSERKSFQILNIYSNRFFPKKKLLGRY